MNPGLIVKINEDHPNEKKQRLFRQGSQPPSLMFGRDSESGKGDRQVCSGKGEGARCALTAISRRKLQAS